MARRGKRAIIYVRQSTFKEESISTDVQIEHCLAACKRQGYEVVPDPVTGAIATIDVNLSGRSFKNRSIVPIIQRIESGDAQTVMTWKWSRWGRNLVESLLCLAELKQAGGQLESATEPLDASTPAGRFSVHQMLAIAEFQSDSIGSSWRDAKRSMIIRKGLPPTGGARFGYEYDKATKKYTPHPVNGPALQYAYGQYNSGASFSALTKYLRGRGICSTNGNPIAEPGLRYAMDSGFAAGYIRLDKPDKILTESMLDEIDLEHGQSIFLPNFNKDGERGWEPLVTEDTWLAYQIRRRKQKATPVRARNAVQPLSRLLRCAGCGKRMLYRPDRQRWNCCSAKLKKAGESCPIKVTISQADATHAVQEWLMDRRDGRDTEAVRARIARQQAARRAHGDITDLERELRRQEGRRQNLLSLAADGTLGRDEIRSSLDAINAEIETLTDSLVDARRNETIDRMPPESSFGAVLAAWGKLDPAMVNAGLSALIDSIIVYPFRQFPRVIVIGRGESIRDLPVAEIPSDNVDGRTCLGCKEYLPRDEFYVRVRNGKELMLSRCKRCKAKAVAEWRRAQAELKAAKNQ